MLSHKGERVTHLKALSFFWAMAPPPDLPAVRDVKMSDDVIYRNIIYKCVYIYIYISINIYIYIHSPHRNIPYRI